MAVDVREEPRAGVGSDVFISYAREDQDFVRRLTDALTERGKKAGSIGRISRRPPGPTGAGRVTCDLCIELDRLVPLARERVTRELTPEERATYLGERP
jgi:hypothetical protein